MVLVNLGKQILMQLLKVDKKIQQQSKLDKSFKAKTCNLLAGQTAVAVSYIQTEPKYKCIVLYKNNGNSFRLLESIRIKTGNSSHMHYPPIPYTQHLPNTTQCGTNRKRSLKWTVPPTNDSACPVACGLKLQTQCGATASNCDCTFSPSSFNTHQAARSFLPFPTGSLPCVTLLNIPSHPTSLSSTNTPHFSQLEESHTEDTNSL